MPEPEPILELRAPDGGYAGAGPNSADNAAAVKADGIAGSEANIEDDAFLQKLIEVFDGEILK